MSYGKAERNIVNEISDPETLCCLIGQMPEYLEAVRELREQIAADESSVGTFTRMSGFAAGGNMQRVGWIPEKLFVAVEKIFPGFFKDQKRRDRFLKENPIFNLRTKAH